MKMHGQRGVAMIEFAIVLPFLILLLLGLVEIGRYAYFSIVVANAARAGVQYAAQNGVTAKDSTGITTAVRTDSTANGIVTLNASSSQSCKCWNGSTATAVTCSTSMTCASGSHIVEYVTVTATGTASPIFHYPLLPASITVSSSATQRIVGQ